MLTVFPKNQVTESTIEFPERPGALRKFLLGMQHDWNISMFHYRNHGAGEIPFIQLSADANHLEDIGKVLAGIQVPSKDQEIFKESLQKLNYPYVEETENWVYSQYLRSSQNK